MYLMLVLISMVLYYTSQFIWIGGSIRASRTMHERLTKAILNTTLRFLDRTPVGRILQRFSADIRSIDGPLPDRTENLIELTINLVERMLVIVVFTPAFLLPGMLLAIVGNYIAQIYIKAQLPIKRCVPLHRSTVETYFGLCF